MEDANDAESITAPRNPYAQMEELCKLSRKNRKLILRDTLLNLFVAGAWINAKIQDPMPRKIDGFAAAALSLGVSHQYQTHKDQRETRRLIEALFNQMPTVEMEAILKKHNVRRPSIASARAQSLDLLKPQS